MQVVPLTAHQKELLKNNPNLRYRHVIAQETITPRSQVNLKESRFLGRLVSSLEYEGPIIEIGTLFGWSTRIICLFKETGRELISVDNYSWNPFKLPPGIHFETTKQILSEAISQFNLKLLRMDNVDFYRTYSGTTPALIFIDADHEYEAVRLDIKGAKKLNAGVICGHDYNREHCPGVVKAVDEFGGPREIVDSLWVL
jgi:predicted O-methyltransferase YrrM